MSEKPDVSVILPVRNAADTIGPAIDSILCQTGVTWELIVIDDGSSDGTAESLAHIRHPAVQVHRQPARGIVAALELGLRRARGRSIARMDADDISAPGRLACQYRYLMHHPDLGLVGCRVAFAGDRNAGAGYARYVDWTNSLLTPEEIETARFIECPFVHPSIMFRSDLIERLGGYRPGPFPEDYELVLRWLEAGVRMARVPEALLHWHDHPQRLSRTHARYARAAFHELKAGPLARWLQRHNPHHPDVVIWGAGRVTRAKAAPLRRHGIRLSGFIDIDPRKSGTPLAGAPRYHSSDFPPPADIFVLNYVEVPGARGLVDTMLRARGFTEGVHYLHCA